MTRRRKWLLALGAALAAAFAAVVAVVHAPPVQEAVFRRAAEAIERETGWSLAAEGVSLRAFPARLSARDLVLQTGGRTVLAADAIEARWSWRGLLAEPRRIESLVVEGPTLDLEALPALEAGETPTELDPWRTFEIGTLRVSGAAISGGALDLDVEVEGLDLGGSLVGGRAEVAIAADRVALMRLTRTLDLGRLDLEAAADRGGVTVQLLSLVGAATALELVGALTTEGGPTGAFEVEIEADVPVVADWWDPNLVSGLSPEGRLDLFGSVAASEGSGLEADLEHRGEPLQIAGYVLDELRLGYRAGRPMVAVAGEAWGRASVEIDPNGVAEVSANLEKARVDRLLAFAAPEAAQALRGPAVVSGQIAGRVGYPIAPEDVEGRLDLVLEWADGSLAVAGAGAGLSWQVDRFEARAAGTRVTGSGSIAADGAVQGRLALAAPRPAETAAALGQFVPAPGLPAIAGGAIAASATIGGSLGEPTFTAALTWDRPEIEGRGLRSASLSAEGDLERQGWTLDLEPVVGTTLTAKGAARLQDAAGDGSWRLSVDDLGRLAAWAAPELVLDLRGELEAEGTLELREDLPRIAGTVGARDVGVSGWVVDDLQLGFAADPGALAIRDLAIEAFGGALHGALTVDLVDPDRGLAGAFAWQDLDLARIPLELPPAAAGFLRGELNLRGSVASPEGAATLAWTPRGEPSLLLEGLEARAEIADGRLEVAVQELATAFGEVEVAASAPLGGLGLPGGLWPGAPTGPAHATVRLADFDSRALVEATGAADPGVDATADLAAELWWDPQRPDAMRASGRVDNLRVRVPGGVLVADGPLVVAVDGGRLEIAPFALEGVDSRFELEAEYLPASEQLAARIHAEVSPQLARVVPLPLRVRGPLLADVQLHAPVAAGLALDSVRGSLVVDHRGGSMVMRDPAVEVRDLQLTARLTGRGLDIVDGSATVNGGRVELGGGWDPASRQGIVVSLDSVAFLTEGILTTWDGELAVAPLPERLAEVTGELRLRRGIWEENVDLAAIVLGGEALVLAVDDPLHDIALDVTVNGRTGIEVANNLGRFNASWSTLRVGGTAAEPKIRGEVRIAPGGTLALGGQEVRVGRGSLRFTGDPTIDPILEIVPDSDLALLEGFDPTVAATRSVAQGITSALGFDNTTLRPEEIAVQTQRDPSSRFLVAKRLSPDLALFFATDLSNVQDNTTMLQAWNFRWLRGLVLQAYQETLTDEVGGNALQRFRWGGSPEATDRPQIFRLRFEGEWPLGRRTLRQATGLRRGQLYDPFLAFVGSVRLERELAAVGYQEAVVVARVEGSERSPTIVFTAEPGHKVLLEFNGIDPGRTLRREATALYSPPPLEAASFEAIRALVLRQLAAASYPHATVVVGRAGDVVEVAVDRGDPLELRGPILWGMPPDGQQLLGQTLRSPAALAAMLRRPDWAARAVERELAVHGYLEAEVRSVDEVPVAPGVAEVRVKVAPGPRAVIREVVVTGEDPHGLVAEGTLQVRAGDPLDRRAIERAVRELRVRYEDLGYRAAAAQWRVQEGDGGWLVEVELLPGRQRALREVRFEGTRHTKPRVLATGLTVKPGELLTDRDIDVSASQIASFDTVERIEVRAVPVGTSEVDLEFDVAERPRWRAEVGGGWSSERGVSATFGIRDAGLLGRGISLDLRGSWSSPDRRIFLVGSIPAVPGGRLSFISTLGYREGDATDEPELLAQEEVLASLEAQYQLRGSTQVGFYYRWTETHTFEKAPDEFNPLPVDETIGLGLLGGRLVIDRFDDLFDPRSGWGFTTDLGWSSSALASDFDYLTSLSNLKLVLEPFSGATWVQSLRVGAAEPLKDQNLIREARFFAGGQASLRGFDLDSVGPVTFGIDFSLVPAGGGALFILNEELRIPVRGSLRGAVFADVGQVWERWGDADLELSVGVGVGIRWSTPIGPLWADVAWPVANVGISSKKAKFYLGIGRPF